MSGPDLLNSLFGILQRFRLGSIAMMADIESMFHQVLVPKVDANALRFFWKRDPTHPGPPETYRMNVHIFGAADSPCCANYALQWTALDNTGTCSSQATQSVLQDFYVDDLLKSVETPSLAISLEKELIELLARGGFCLHKWMSNSTEVLGSINESERAIQNVDLALDRTPTQQTLGLYWDLAGDSFVFDPAPKDMPHMKRGVLSIVSSIFNPTREMPHPRAVATTH